MTDQAPTLLPKANFSAPVPESPLGRNHVNTENSNAVSLLLQNLIPGATKFDSLSKLAAAMPSVPDPFLPSQQPATTPAIRPRDRDVLSPPPRKKVKLEGTEGVKEIRTPNMRSSRDTEAMVQSQPGVISKQREIANKPAPSFGGGSNSMPSVHVSVIVSCASGIKTAENMVKNFAQSSLPTRLGEQSQASIKRHALLLETIQTAKAIEETRGNNVFIEGGSNNWVDFTYSDRSEWCGSMVWKFKHLMHLYCYN